MFSWIYYVILVICCVYVVTLYFTAWKLLFKASSSVSSSRLWSDMWLDQDYVNDDESAALLTQPTEVFKSALANSWDDSTNIDYVRTTQVCVLNSICML